MNLQDTYGKEASRVVCSLNKKGKEISQQQIEQKSSLSENPIAMKHYKPKS